MDRVESKGSGASAGSPPVNRFAWLPSAMPGVARLMAEKRVKFGPAHVAECWKQGVINGQAGWLFAREGTLAVGTPWDGDPVMANFAGAWVTSGQALLIIREPG